MLTHTKFRRIFKFIFTINLINFTAQQLSIHSYSRYFSDAFDGMAIEIDPIKIKTAIVINKFPMSSLKMSSISLGPLIMNP